VSALDGLRAHYRHRDQAAREWKRAGGQVVGYLCDNVPEELIIAAGLLPYRLSGDPDIGSEALDRYVRPFAPPFSARNRGVGFVDAMLSMVLTGRFDFVDYLLIPHTRKSIQAFYRELLLARDAYPELKLPQMYYLDRAYTPFYTAEVFNRDRVVELKRQLELWSGHAVSNAALAAAIEVTNTNRRLLRRLAALRAVDPPRLSGVDALQAIATSFFMDKREHNRLLTAVIDEVTDSLADRPRLFIAGSPLDHLQLYELVEACGAVVVAEDHCWGNRCGELEADVSMPPLEALADRYHRRPACSIEFPMARVVDRCVSRASAAGVDGAIFFVMDGDGVHVWDAPAEIAALEGRGLRCLYLSQQPYDINDPEPIREKVTTFIASLRQ
jgi:benzoyl-CoA reductase/2-hydroxyglutaryl-CoA dehydratase subunit BcrC/BadD/HgdB